MLSYAPVIRDPEPMDAVRAVRRPWLRFLVVVLISLAGGALTRVGERILPDSIQSAANSTAPWVFATFVMVYVSALRGRSALALGAASFVALDLGFYLAFFVTGGYYPRHYLAFWLAVAVVAGPLVAGAALWVRRAGIRGAVAIASVPSVFVGEAVFILLRLPIVGRIYPAILLAGGVVLFVAVCLFVRAPRRTILLALGCVVVGSALFALAYNLVPLVIGKVVP